MNTSATPTKKIDVKVLLSTLWIVVMINLLTADILGLYIPGTAGELAKTSASTGTPIPQLMLGGAVMNELAIVMIILSRVLNYGLNRWVNIIRQPHHDRVCGKRRNSLSSLHFYSNR